jgi:hypothetical protein
MSSTARITDTGRKGDLRIGFGFERQPPRGEPEACMYLYAARSPRQVASIPIRQMWMFDTRTEADRDKTGEYEAMKYARTVAKAVYDTQNPSDMDTRRCLNAIEDFMTDLKNMPPPSTWRNPETLEQALAAKGYDMVNAAYNGRIIH